MGDQSEYLLVGIPTFAPSAAVKAPHISKPGICGPPAAHALTNTKAPGHQLGAFSRMDCPSYWGSGGPVIEVDRTTFRITPLTQTEQWRILPLSEVVPTVLRCTNWAEGCIRILSRKPKCLLPRFRTLRLRPSPARLLRSHFGKRPGHGPLPEQLGRCYGEQA